VIELKNIILRRVSIFEFSHSQGHLQTCPAQAGMSASPLKADIRASGQHIRQGAKGDIPMLFNRIASLRDEPDRPG
jgi:hypothetical protein